MEYRRAYNIFMRNQNHSAVGKRSNLESTPSVKTTIVLDADLKTWGKRQPGGLSRTVRDLMRQAKEQDASPASDVMRLAEPILTREWDTPEEDEAWQYLQEVI